MADFSPTRTHATWKPRVTAAHVPFFRCKTCGHVSQHSTTAEKLPFAMTESAHLSTSLPILMQNFTLNAAENLWNSLSQFLTKKSKTRLN